MVFAFPHNIPGSAPQKAQETEETEETQSSSPLLSQKPFPLPQPPPVVEIVF